MHARAFNRWQVRELNRKLQHLGFMIHLRLAVCSGSCRAPAAGWVLERNSRYTGMYRLANGAQVSRHCRFTSRFAVGGDPASSTESLPASRVRA
jgi:hypothetical protein